MERRTSGRLAVIETYQDPSADHEPFTFSQRQQKAISEMSLSYMRKHGIAVNRQTLESVFYIVGIDAVSRGKALLDVPELSSRHDLRPLIRAGLANREETLQQYDWSAGDFTQDYRNSRFHEPVGCLALEYDMFSSAQKERRDPLLQSDFSSIGETLVQIEERRKLLPSLASLALDNLSQDLGVELSLDRLKTEDDMAKIVRNMIVSHVMRGDANPSLTVSELKEFSQEIEGSEIEDFSPRVEDFFCYVEEALDINDDMQESYRTFVRDLSKQAFASLLRNVYVVRADSTRHYSLPRQEIDYYYLEYSKRFLLMHPVFERSEIVTSLEKHEDGASHSLWSDENSVVVDGYRIPTVDGLLLAMRDRQARGLSDLRFRDGRRAWRRSADATPQHESRLVRLTENRKKIEEEIEELEGIDFEINQGVLRSARKEAKDAVDDYITLRKEINKRTQFVAKVEGNLRQVAGYVAEIEEFDLDDVVDIPEWLLTKQKNLLQFRNKSRKSRSESRVRHGVLLLLKSNPFRNIEKIKVDSIDWVSGSDEEISEALSSLRARHIAVRNGASLEDHLEYIPEPHKLRLFIENEIYSLKRENKRAETRSRTERLERFFGYKEKVNAMLGLVDEAEYLALARSVYVEFFGSEERGVAEIIRGRELRDSALYTSEDDLSETWTVEEAKEYEKLAELSVCPDLDEEGTEEHISEIEHWLQSYSSRGKNSPVHLPKEVESVESIFEYVADRIEKTENTIAKLERRPESEDRAISLRNARERIRIYQDLVDLFDNPLFPIADYEGVLFRNEFLKRIRERVRHYRFATEMPRQEQLFEDAASRVRDGYRKSLRKRAAFLQRRYNEEYRKTPEVGLVETMQKLGLALKVE